MWHPDDAASSSTDTERYRVLHHVADELLDALTAAFEVERADRPGDAVEPRIGPRIERSVLLRPASPAASPLEVEFTAFPGLLVRCGRFSSETLPRCGCDACAEDPADLLDLLRDVVGIVVAGGLSESVSGRRRVVLGSHWSNTPDRSGWQTDRYFASAPGTKFGRRGVRRWEAWRPRPGAGSTPPQPAQ